MEYDESLFKAIANKRARNIWLIFFATSDSKLRC